MLTMWDIVTTLQVIQGKNVAAITGITLLYILCQQLGRYVATMLVDVFRELHISDGFEMFLLMLRLFIKGSKRSRDCFKSNETNIAV